MLFKRIENSALQKYTSSLSNERKFYCHYTHAAFKAETEFRSSVMVYRRLQEYILIKTPLGGCFVFTNTVYKRRIYHAKSKIHPPPPPIFNVKIKL